MITAILFYAVGAFLLFVAAYELVTGSQPMDRGKARAVVTLFGLSVCVLTMAAILWKIA